MRVAPAFARGLAAYFCQSVYPWRVPRGARTSSTARPSQAPAAKHAPLSWTALFLLESVPIGAKPFDLRQHSRVSDSSADAVAAAHAEGRSRLHYKTAERGIRSGAVASRYRGADALQRRRPGDDGSDWGHEGVEPECRASVQFRSQETRWGKRK